MNAVLVTGGAGYIGSHTCKALSKAGYLPVCLDDLSGGHKHSVQWGPLVQLSLSNLDGIIETVKKYDVEAVIHFAGSIEAGHSMMDPAAFYANNVANTIVLLDAMRITGLRRIVFSSSAAVYGIPTLVPIPENHPLIPINPYGETKLVIERALHWYSCAYRFQFAALRYFNAAGADPDGQIGECHNPETHLIPLIVKACISQHEKLKIFGTDYPTADGTTVRDYVHVTDLANAHLAALRWLNAGHDNLIVNIGTGIGHSIRQVLNVYFQLTGIMPPYEEVARRLGDPHTLVADPALAKSTIGWVPIHSKIENIISTAYKWHSARHSNRELSI